MAWWRVSEGQHSGWENRDEEGGTGPGKEPEGLCGTAKYCRRIQMEDAGRGRSEEIGEKGLERNEDHEEEAP